MRGLEFEPKLTSWKILHGYHYIKICIDAFHVVIYIYKIKGTLHYPLNSSYVFCIFSVQNNVILMWFLFEYFNLTKSILVLIHKESNIQKKLPYNVVRKKRGLEKWRRRKYVMGILILREERYHFNLHRINLILTSRKEIFKSCKVDEKGR